MHITSTIGIGGYAMKMAPPQPDTNAYALAAKERIRIIPYGDQAAYKLGLSGLGISHLKYLTDGVPRRINLS